MRLVAGLRPNPVGELTALPQTSSWIRGKRGKGGKGEGEGRRGKKERGGPPKCLKCVDASVHP